MGGADMIAKITGILDEIGPSWVILDAMGVGYQLHCSGRTLSVLPQRGETVSLRVAMVFKQDHVVLYGFFSSAERQCFEVLQTVQGVGSKVALGILSILSPEEIIYNLERKDHLPFVRADGVGPKLAQRLVHELSGKSDLWSKLVSFTPDSYGPLPVKEHEATSALLNLGYRRSEIEAALAQVDTTLPIEIVLTQVLQILAQKAS